MTQTRVSWIGKKFAIFLSSALAKNVENIVLSKANIVKKIHLYDLFCDITLNS